MLYQIKDGIKRTTWEADSAEQAANEYVKAEYGWAIVRLNDGQPHNYAVSQPIKRGYNTRVITVAEAGEIKGIDLTNMGEAGKV